MTAGDGRIVVTGAAGRVGRLLLAHRTWPRLRLVDRVATPGAVPVGADWLEGDLADPDFAAAAVAGAEAIVHLAGDPRPFATFEQLRAPNVDAVHHLLEAAARAGVARVVLASSIHALGGYNAAGHMPVDPSGPSWPCCAYGTAKVAVEAMARETAERSDTAVLCLRLGAVLEEPDDQGAWEAWLGPEDLAQLVELALTSTIGYGTYLAVSAQAEARWSLERTRTDLGYVPISTTDVAQHDLPRPAPIPGCTLWARSPGGRPDTAGPGSQLPSTGEGARSWRR